ncbi:bleomycin resistance protein [Candidatus Bathyarchaeota archaeon]|nr:bleomycin resistance protein [Candidatus Bathyarchaeota archaeon]
MSDSLFQYLDCLNLPVDDLEKALEFYRDKLGHSLIWKTRDSAGLRLPDGKSELVIRTDKRPPETDIKVESVPDAIIRFVEADGSVVVEPFDISVGKCVVVEDPWGNRLILLDSSKGRLVTDGEGNVTGNAPVEG